MNRLVAKIKELTVKKIRLREDINNIIVNKDPKNFPLCSSVRILIKETPSP